MLDYYEFKAGLIDNMHNMFAECDVVMGDTSLNENVKLARLADIGSKYGADLTGIG